MDSRANATRRLTLWVRLTDAVLLGVALAFALVFVLVVAVRLTFPFALNDLDFGFLQQVRRVLHHQSLFPAPSVSFVPYQYTPLYYYVSALAAHVLGDGFLPLRAVSFAASLVSIAFIGHIVRRETGSVRSGILAACLFAATYRVSPMWFDVPSTDMLLLALLLAAMYAARFSSNGMTGILAAAGLMTLAFLTKQTALIVGVGLAACWDRRRAVLFLGVFGAGIVLSTLLLVALEGPLYPLYVFRLSTQQAHWGNLHQGFTFWAHDLLGVLPIALVIVAYWWSRQTVGGHTPSAARARFYAAALGGTIIAALVSRVLQRSGTNATLPVYALIAILLGLAVHELRRIARRKHDRAAELLIASLYLAQFLMLAYVPWHVTLTEPTYGIELRTIIDTPSGLTDRPLRTVWDAADRTAFAFGPAVLDVLNGGTPDITRAFVSSLQDAVCHPGGEHMVIVHAALFDPEILGLLVDRPVESRSGPAILRDGPSAGSAGECGRRLNDLMRQPWRP